APPTLSPGDAPRYRERARLPLYLRSGNEDMGRAEGMSRRLLKFSGGSVTQFLTWSRFQGRVSETATAYTALGVRPSNRWGNDVYLCCTPTTPTAALRDC